MSDHAAGGHADMDYPQHYATYNGFLTAIKVCLGALILLLVGMFIFLV